MRSEPIDTVSPTLTLGAQRVSDDFARLMSACEHLPPVPTAVVHPCDESSLRAAVEAAEAGLIEPLLIGPARKIIDTARRNQLDISPYEFFDVAHSHAAAEQGVALVLAGEVAALMKGSLHTDELMGEVTARLRTERRISHVFLLDLPSYPRPLLISDAAINIFPDLAAKRDICQNAIELAHCIGIDVPKVAILSAVETVTPKIPSTLEAAALCKMAERGQIRGGLLEGPLAMDNAISEEAARAKGIDSPVAGKADILIVPDLEAGNMLAKQLTFLAGAEAAGLVLGARVPIILTSRADNVRTRRASCAIAKLYVQSRQRPTLAAAD